MSGIDGQQPVGRREFMHRVLTGVTTLGLCGVGVVVDTKSGTQDLVWQLDPAKCTQCGRCATACVLEPSAVKCVHTHAMCGYCQLCFGYFRPGANALDSAAENQTCPTGAITRTFIEDPYFEYGIDEALCFGCAKCVKTCNAFGNGSLFLQVRHDRCVNCNECAIARVCPSRAFRRVPVDRPYLLKGAQREESDEAAV